MMDEYIKREDALNALLYEMVGTGYQSRAMDAIKFIPTADVVPKSEVERLEQILNSYALQYGTVKDQQAVIDKAKAEVAREIFEEIEKILDRNYYDHPFEYYASYMSVSIRQLKKKYTEN